MNVSLFIVSPATLSLVTLNPELPVQGIFVPLLYSFTSFPTTLYPIIDLAFAWKPVSTSFPPVVAIFSVAGFITEV